MRLREETSRYFEEFRAKITRFPDHLHGTERQKWLAEMLDRSSLEVRNALKEIIEYHLQLMKDVEASDIDMGGDGCNGQIWYRIHGDKKPFEDSPALSLPETDAMLLNLLSKDQQEHLFEHRNLDFSHVIPGVNGPNQRFCLSTGIWIFRMSFRARTDPTSVFAPISISIWIIWP